MEENLKEWKMLIDDAQKLLTPVALELANDVSEDEKDKLFHKRIMSLHKFVKIHHDLWSSITYDIDNNKMIRETTATILGYIFQMNDVISKTEYFIENK